MSKIEHTYPGEYNHQTDQQNDVISEELQQPERTLYDPNKTFVERLQRKTDKFVVTARELSSRGASFLIAMLGVILQASHTSLLMYDVSGFDSVILRTLVALGLGVFISCALAVFTIKHNGENEQIGKIINIFFIFEVFTNLFYYFNSLIFSKVEQGWDFTQVDTRNWLYLVVAIPFSFIVPFAIKQFAGVISSDDKLKFGSIEGPAEVIVELTSDQEKELTNATNEIKLLQSKNEELSVQIESIGDYSEDVRNLKSTISKEYLKRGEAFSMDIDGKKSTVTIK